MTFFRRSGICPVFDQEEIENKYLFLLSFVLGHVMSLCQWAAGHTLIASSEKKNFIWHPIQWIQESSGRKSWISKGWMRNSPGNIFVLFATKSQNQKKNWCFILSTSPHICIQFYCCRIIIISILFKYVGNLYF